MGATLDYHFFPTRSKKKLLKMMRTHWEELLALHGHEEGYAGYLHMKPCSPEFVNKRFRSFNRLQDSVFVETNNKIDKPLAFQWTENGKKGYMVIGWCSS